MRFKCGVFLVFRIVDCWPLKGSGVVLRGLRVSVIRVGAIVIYFTVDAGMC
jgi:hypothetical protein